MPKVHLLPDDVIRQIAAGEVIERPASAVKELLENSLDAQSDSIEIHLKDAGKILLQIKDTGHGIEKDDLEKIFLRHATSKIASADDLHNIQSLGFRGEALYSIAAIADVTLRSQTPGQDSGWEIHWRGGQKKDFRPRPMANGTEVEVRELFFNTPARRKFLKSNTTELNQILNVVIPYTLLHPHVRFQVTHEGKILLDLKPVSKPLNSLPLAPPKAEFVGRENTEEASFISPLPRIAETLNLEKGHLMEIRNSDAENQISIHAVLGDINIKRPQRDMQFIFVNQRPVQNKSISYHMNRIYQLIFPPRVYPFFAVFVAVPAEQVDVNIHPTKREVKIKNESVVCAQLRSLCEQALMSAGQAKVIRVAAKADAESSLERAVLGSHTSELTFENVLSPEILESASETLKEPAGQPYVFPRREIFPKEEQPSFLTPQKENLQSKLSRARFLGSWLNKFLLFECWPSLLVVDQHAAQERIAFEKLMRQMEAGTVEVQHLLTPILINLSTTELLAWEEAKEKLTQVGFESTLFDKETIAIHSYPVLLRNAEPAVRLLLSGDNIAACDHETIARRACRSSVMAGDYLNKEKAEYQRDQLIKCRDPFTCPHGRPTVIEMSEKFFDRQFLRT